MVRMGLKQRPRPSEGHGLSPARERVFDAIAAATEAYRPPAYVGGPAIYVRAQERLAGYYDPKPAWQRAARGGLEIIEVPDGHLDIVDRNAALVARHLDARLLALAGQTAAGQR
jgi:acetoacetyl-CoA synthetase